MDSFYTATGFGNAFAWLIEGFDQAKSSDECLAGVVFSDVIQTSYFRSSSASFGCTVVGFGCEFQSWMHEIKDCPTGVHIYNNNKKGVRVDGVQRGQVQANPQDVLAKRVYVKERASF